MREKPGLRAHAHSLLTKNSNAMSYSGRSTRAASQAFERMHILCMQDYVGNSPPVCPSDHRGAPIGMVSLSDVLSALVFEPVDYFGTYFDDAPTTA